jgi:hypothetical protein
VQDEPFEDDEVEAAPPEEGDPNTITMYPVPPVMWKEGEEKPETPREISTILVYRKRGMRDMPYIGWKPAKEIWELDDLLNVYGAGTYQLDGRGDDRRDNIRRVLVTVGDPDARQAQQIVRPKDPPDLGKVVASVIGAAAVALGPIVTMWQESARERREEQRREREREEERRADERRRDDERHQQQMEFLAKLGAARNDDLVNLMRAQSEQGRTSGSASDYQQGQADMVALLAEMREGGFGKEDPESKVLDMLNSLIAGGRVGRDQAEAIKNAVRAQANGEGGG